MSDAKAPGIFKEVVVAFVRGTSSLPTKEISTLAESVVKHGGEVCEPRKDGSLQLEQITHIVSNTIDFKQYTESQAFMIPVVNSKWIPAALLRRRQPNVRPYSPDPRLFFSALTVTCAGLPQTDTESIIGATLAMGGTESKDATKLTSHICALSIDHPKVQAAIANKLKAKIVLPHWFEDCFKLGKRIDEGPYLLPNPEILSVPAEADLDIPENKALEGATSANPQDLPLPADDNIRRPSCTVFRDQQIMFSEDIATSNRSRLMRVLAEIIVRGGGALVEDIDEADIFICQFRAGDAYIKASQACKTVGNLAWLYHLIVHNEWTSPLKRLLHYPVPRDGIEGFRDMKITVSNYGGEARVYLENLIKACGAEYTKTMKQDNTHLITARDSSEKVNTAPEWGIDVINHLWLEESYAKCVKKPLTVPKYRHFPPRTNLGEIIGQTPLDESRLRDIYYPGGEDTMSTSAKRKRKILEAADENTYGVGPGEGIMKTTAELNDSMEDVQVQAPRKRAIARASTATPARSHVASGKENDTPAPLSTGGRSAKVKALDNLHHIAPDIALYEKEKKRRAKDGVWGGKRAADQAEKEKEPKSAKGQQAADDEEKKRPAKKARPTVPAIELRIVLTGYTRWVGDSTKEDNDRRKLRNLGIQIINKPEDNAYDYLCAPQVVRTVKFLVALARGVPVISSDFITHILDKNTIPDPKRFLLSDPENETKYDINLTKSVSRARANNRKLLHTIGIFCTDKIRNGPEAYRNVAEANGAIFKIYRARSGVALKPTTAEEDGFRDPEPVYLLSSNSGEEKAMWPRFREMAERAHMEPRVVAPDWLLDVAMAQNVRFDEKFLVENFFVPGGI